MATALRTTLPAIPEYFEQEPAPTDAERADMLTDTAHSLIAETSRLERENAALVRDVKSLKSRTTMLTRALNDGVGAVLPILTLTDEASDLADIHSLLYMARLCEQSGRVPCLRFTRDTADTITGVTLLVVQQAAPAPSPDGFTILCAEMSCYIDGDAA